MTVGESIGLGQEVLPGVTVFELVILALALLAAYLLGRLVSYAMKKHYAASMSREQIGILTKTVRIIFLLVTVIIVVPSILDFSATLMVFLIIALGSVLALASNKVIGNILAGVVLRYERPYTQDDYISVGDVSGYVCSQKLMSTTIRTKQGMFVRLPNDKVCESTLSNTTRYPARRFEMEVNVRYEADLDKAVRIIRAKVEAHPFVLHRPRPDVFVARLDESAVALKFRLWLPSCLVDTSNDDINIRLDLAREVKAALENEGISIPFRQLEVTMAKEPTQYQKLQ